MDDAPINRRAMQTSIAILIACVAGGLAMASFACWGWGHFAPRISTYLAFTIPFLWGLLSSIVCVINLIIVLTQARQLSIDGDIIMVRRAFAPSLRVSRTKLRKPLHMNVLTCEGTSGFHRYDVYWFRWGVFTVRGQAIEARAY